MVEPSRQNSTHCHLIVSNQINKKASKFFSKDMQMEAPSISKATNDPHLLPEQKIPIVIEKI